MLRRLYGRPWLLLSLCALFWAGNAVAGKLAIGHISPMMLTALRWIGACAVLMLIGGRPILADIKAHRRHLPFLFLLGGIGLTGFNAFLYLAALTTDGMNLMIIQGAIPIMILVGAALFLRQPFGPVQMIGVVLTMAGVVLTATRGEPQKLLALAFNHGDLLMLLASLCYAAYALLLKRRPAMPAAAFFLAVCMGAALSAVAALAVEIGAGLTFMPTARGWAILAYCIAFPSLLSQLFFIRGVELIGAARAGLCVNLIPVFGAVLMVAAGEPFVWSHALALVLVLAGVMIAERFRKTEATKPAA
jgi:drug/metabolite transporter (DMT)-like permease